ncbi:mesogenin-1 [Chanos chanos]|uniref:Mesogenin-1 n=1 Tax=Chanos chanos TaxID=29144 RepID=A0A6J2VZS1_CHACN|nr:mesogenin-1 [Chanos chanos]
MDNLAKNFAQMDGDVDVMTAKLLSYSEWKGEEKPFGNSQESSPCHSSSSESQFDSACSSPKTQVSTKCHSFPNFPFALPGHSATPPVREKASKPKMSTKRRIKASEREKMRMRSLAEALHQLRDYLPPDYSQRGQPLTKIQTLKYTIEYIKELSDILKHA